MEALNYVPFRRPVVGRDPNQKHRVATELELLFDLIFVVAIASNAAQLHHGIVGGHWDALIGYLMTWCAIWWAWVNYSWYASAYDNDDVIYRLLTFVIMAGALCLAAAVPDLFADGQSVLAVVGYAIMRFGMVGLWLRVAQGDKARRKTALRYAAGITFAQLLWIGRLEVPSSWLIATFFVCVAIEWMVPVWAEKAGKSPFHPHHIAERYGLMTIIVLGEVMLSSVQAIQGALGLRGEGGHAVSSDFFVLIIGGLIAVFALWWLYFKRNHADIVANEKAMWIFGYGHYFIFASVAAVGAGLAAAVDVVEGSHEVHTSAFAVSMFIGVSIAIFALVLVGMHVASDRADLPHVVPAVFVAVGALLMPWLGLSLGWTVLAQALVITLALGQHVVRSQAR
mgnify:CR=1 FL=1